jgi:hypothetical protein
MGLWLGNYLVVYVLLSSSLPLVLDLLPKAAVLLGSAP